MDFVSFPFLATIFVASLAGSGHCAGMCGPLMILATNRNETIARNANIRELLYHFGRLISYSLFGMLAGGFGYLINSGGNLAGLQRIASIVAGAGMILFGLYTLYTTIRKKPLHYPGTQFITRLLIQFKKKMSRISRYGEPLGIGLLSAGLPCGWLYAFLLAAMGTGNPWAGGLVMSAFWIGTIPALSVVGFVSRFFPKKGNAWGTVLIALLLIGSGAFTMTMRAHADMSQIGTQGEQQTPLEIIQGVDEQPLPCCENKSDDN